MTFDTEKTFLALKQNTGGSPYNRHKATLFPNHKLIKKYTHFFQSKTVKVVTLKARGLVSHIRPGVTLYDRGFTALSCRLCHPILLIVFETEQKTDHRYAILLNSAKQLKKISL